MENKEIENIEKQADSLMNNIKELQQQIKSYRDGSEAFSKASEALMSLAKEHEKLIGALTICIGNLEKIEIIKLVKRLDELERKIDTIDTRGSEHFLVINEKLESGVKIKLFKK